MYIRVGKAAAEGGEDTGGEESDIWRERESRVGVDDGEIFIW